MPLWLIVEATVFQGEAWSRFHGLTTMATTQKTFLGKGMLKGPWSYDHGYDDIVAMLVRALKMGSA
ncbi:hypothetical protein F7C95_06740 [Opitutia bacterium ISCC 51]|nr:hypothetical protein F7C95_06740 [Opitutae bacterium ISCC 51]